MNWWVRALDGGNLRVVEEGGVWDDKRRRLFGPFALRDEAMKKAERFFKESIKRHHLQGERVTQFRDAEGNVTYESRELHDL